MGKVEDDDRDLVLAAERDRGVVHYAKIFVDQVKIVETTEPLGLRVLLRIGVIDAVHLRRFEYDFSLDFHCAQGSRRIR